jgi:hypothetical protein
LDGDTVGYIFFLHDNIIKYCTCRELHSWLNVCVLASSAVDRGFEPRSGQTKDYTIGICCLSAKHAALKRKSNNWLARNQDNMSEWSDMSTHGLLFQ